MPAVFVASSATEAVRVGLLTSHFAYLVLPSTFTADLVFFSSGTLWGYYSKQCPCWFLTAPSYVQIRNLCSSMFLLPFWRARCKFLGLVYLKFLILFVCWVWLVFWLLSWWLSCALSRPRCLQSKLVYCDVVGGVDSFLRLLWWSLPPAIAYCSRRCLTPSWRRWICCCAVAKAAVSVHRRCWWGIRFAD